MARLIQGALSTETGESRRPPSLREGDAKYINEAAFVAQINRGLQSLGEALCGSFQVVNLGEFYKSLGNKRAAVTASVEAIVETVIRSGLDSDDVFTKLDGLVFLVFFGTLRYDEARRKCTSVANEIKTHLVEEYPKIKDAHVRSAVTRLEQESGAKEIDVEYVTSKLLRGRADQDNSSARKGDSKIRWRTKGGQAPGRHYTPIPLKMDSEKQEIPFLSVDPSSIRLTYRPIWDVKKEVVSTYHCRPLRFNSASNRLFDDLLPKGTPLAEVLEINIHILQRVIDELKSGAEQKRLSLLSLPVSFETLGGPLARRIRYTKTLHMIPEDWRRMLVAEIVDAPAGAPRSRITEIVEAIKPFVRAVNLRRRIGQKDHSPLYGTGVFAVGVDSSSLKTNETSLKTNETSLKMNETSLKMNETSHKMNETSLKTNETSLKTNETELIVPMQMFVASAKKTGLRTYIHGLPSLRLAAAAARAGFDFMNGDAIASSKSTPASMYKLMVQDVFSKLRDNTEAGA